MTCWICEYSRSTRKHVYIPCWISKLLATCKTTQMSSLRDTISFPKHEQSRDLTSALSLNCAKKKGKKTWEMKYNRVNLTRPIHKEKGKGVETVKKARVKIAAVALEESQVTVSFAEGTVNCSLGNRWITKQSTQII